MSNDFNKHFEELDIIYRDRDSDMFISSIGFWRYGVNMNGYWMPVKKMIMIELYNAD